MNPITALKASGLKPIFINEDTDIEAAVKRQYETNEEFVVRIMNFGCPTGALIQAVVMEALRSYTEHFMRDENRMPENNLISPDAWQETCRWLNSELVKKYG